METLPDAPPPNSAHQPPSWLVALEHCRWPLAFLFSVAMIAFTAFLVMDRTKGAVDSTVHESAELVKAVGRNAKAIADRFTQGNITQTFVASLPTIKSDGSGRLELAILTATERFRSEDELRVIGNYLYLGTTVSEITVPVTYRYHLKLDDAWSLDVSNQTCLVTAPRIRPTLPPSIDTGQMTKSTQNGWARFNADEQLDHLEKGLTSTLAQYASEDTRLDIIREEARETVRAFVQGWLLKEDHWRDDRFHTIVVRFDGEEVPEPLPLAETDVVLRVE